MKYLLFDQMELCTEAEVDRLLAWEPSFRCEQALRYKHLFGRFACLKAYELLWQLLQAEGCCTMPHFEVDTHGKPSMTEYPHLHFSISHCKEAIAVAIDSQPVGIDVEAYREYSEALLERCMNPEEQRVITSANHPSEQFIRYWTQKEAVVKLRGTGLTDNLHDVLTGSEHIRTWNHTTKPYACSIATLT